MNVLTTTERSGAVVQVPVPGQATPVLLTAGPLYSPDGSIIVGQDGRSLSVNPSLVAASESTETRPTSRLVSTLNITNRAVSTLWKGAFTLLFSPLRFNTISWGNGTNTQQLTWAFYQAASGGLKPPFLKLGSITVTPTASVLQSSTGLSTMQAAAGHMIVMFSSATDGALSQGPICWNTGANEIGEVGVVGTALPASQLLPGQFPTEFQAPLGGYSTNPPDQILYADVTAFDASGNLPRGRIELL